jgi:hypothetical protein
MLKLLIPDDVRQSDDSRLQTLGQTDENHRPVRPKRCPFTFGLEHQELFPRKRQQSFNQPADGVADGRSPSRGNATLFHPNMCPALDKQEDLGGDIAIEID